MLFAACEKSEPVNVDNQDKMPDANVEYTLTVLSANSSLGTVSGSGRYTLGTNVKIIATPTKNAEFKSWSDCNVVDTMRIITLTSDSIITATFKERSNGVTNDHEWVNLGLSVKWATCNVGATTPEDYGDYYAWGEIATKNTYNWSTYTLANGNYDALTKYCNSSSYGTVDNKTTLEAADDAATQNWGGNWRMPTNDEWQELKDNCTWTWTTKNSVNGYEVKATNGNSIFLSAAGYRFDGELDLAGSCGYYWSSSLSVFNPYVAQCMLFDSGYHRTNDDYRDYGLSVRPVCK